MIEGWPEISKIGFDGLRLGDNIHDVRGLFGQVGEVMTFRRAGGPEQSDQFVSYGIIVTYNDAGSINFIELARPTDPTVWGVKLLERSAEKVLSDLKRLGISARDRDKTWEGPILEGLGIALWIPHETVESVSIGNYESE